MPTVKQDTRNRMQGLGETYHTHIIPILNIIYHVLYSVHTYHPHPKYYLSCTVHTQIIPILNIIYHVLYNVHTHIIPILNIIYHVL